jgi:hypothetical protein
LACWGPSQAGTSAGPCAWQWDTCF